METNLLIKIVRSAGSIYLLLNLLAYLFSDRLIFVPQPPAYTKLPNQIKIRSGGQTITGVYLENPAAEYTLLFSHGNAEDLDNVVPFMQQFHRLGYSVLMYDYRGYGTSEGTPSTRKAKQDVEAAYRWLVDEKKTAPESIIVHGRSLGGGVATWLASKHPVGGLIIESSFVSTFRVRTVVPLLPWDRFNSLRSIKKVQCPVLVMHGTADEVVPFWHGRKLYEAAPGKKQHLWIEGGRHNDYAYAAGEAYLETISQFIDSIKP